MESLGRAPALLIGHSLGGSAALAAAGDIASVKAVATIGAPAEVEHVLKLLGDGRRPDRGRGAAEVKIGGRPFTIRREFLDDARMHDLLERVAHLRRALLVLHSPVDTVVGIDNASKIFLAARHSKSFVSLDDADHLLTRGEDADYAAAVIAAWAGRYLPMAADTPAEAPDGAVLVEETGAGKFQVQVSAHGSRLFADEPADVGGLGSGLSPFELVSAGLGACTSMTLRLYAERKGWPLRGPAWPCATTRSPARLRPTPSPARSASKARSTPSRPRGCSRSPTSAQCTGRWKAARGSPPSPSRCRRPRSTKRPWPPRRRSTTATWIEVSEGRCAGA